MPKAPKTKKTKKKRYDTSQLLPETSVIPMPVIQNVVATFSLGVKNINLKALALKLKYCDYNPQRFAAMTMRLRKPRTTALAFGSGNMVCTGSKNIPQCLLSCRMYVRILQRSNVKVCFHNFKVQNIVASVALEYPLKLHELSQAHGANVSYEPEMFPGLVLRITNPKIVFLLFRSGKLVITGAKNLDAINHAYRCIYKNILQHYFDRDNLIKSSAIYKSTVKREKIAAT